MFTTRMNLLNESHRKDRILACKGRLRACIPTALLEVQIPKDWSGPGSGPESRVTGLGLTPQVQVYKTNFGTGVSLAFDQQGCRSTEFHYCGPGDRSAAKPTALATLLPLRGEYLSQCCREQAQRISDEVMGSVLLPSSIALLSLLCWVCMC